MSKKFFSDPMGGFIPPNRLALPTPLLSIVVWVCLCFFVLRTLHAVNCVEFGQPRSIYTALLNHVFQCVSRGINSTNVVIVFVDVQAVLSWSVLVAIHLDVVERRLSKRCTVWHRPP